MMRFLMTILALVATTGCLKYRQPKIGDVTPVQPQLSNTGDQQSAVVEQARVNADTARAQVGAAMDSIRNEALATCAPDVCAAIGRGEVALTMTRTQVLAATNSTPGAWNLRGTAQTGSLLPGPVPVRDRIGEVVIVTLRDGGVVSYTYRDPAGLRTIAAPEDATLAGRRRVTAENLLRQGDDLIAAGRSDEALGRYDQADVMDPNNPETTLRIAKLLDKELRPVEALMRYQKFLHEMDIERINATGQANANLAAAVVAAQARVVYLRQTTATNK